MKQKRLVSLIGILGVLIGTLFMMTGCEREPPEAPKYTKENFVLKFKNESGKKCYIEIRAKSRPAGGVIASAGWENYFYFPTVLKTEIPVGGEKSITVKDVVVSGKTSYTTHLYNPIFDIHVIPEESMYDDNWETFSSESKDQYTGGTFRIKLQGNTFKIDFAN